MKLVILVAAICICATSASRFVLPRVPLALLLRGNVPLIDLDNRIVGGDEVKPENSLPFQVSIQTSDGFHFCGGSILDENTVLCAAHCWESNVDDLQVVAGEHSLETVSGKEQTRKVKTWTRNPIYNPNKLSNDSSIIKVSEPFDLSVLGVKPIRLPTADECKGGPDNVGLEDGEPLVVSGWGATFEGGPGSDKLQKVVVPYVTRADCNKAYGAGSITESMICAGNIKNGGIDSCQGDSGGPLFKEVDNAFIQYGIVSWGFGCARPGYPGVYSSVCAQIDWIKQTAGLP